MLGTLVDCKECPEIKELIGEPVHGSVGFELLRGDGGVRGDRHIELKKNFEQKD